MSRKGDLYRATTGHWDGAHSLKLAFVVVLIDFRGCGTCFHELRSGAPGNAKADHENSSTN